MPNASPSPSKKGGSIFLSISMFIKKSSHSCHVTIIIYIKGFDIALDFIALLLHYAFHDTAWVYCIQPCC